MEPNDYQIGGAHYKKEYQHWDFVCDTDMPYLLGCATKYIARWKEKGGIEDIRKSIHYLAKAEDRGKTMPKHQSYLVTDFCRQLGEEESTVIQVICANNFKTATALMEEMIAEAETNPNYIRG